MADIETLRDAKEYKLRLDRIEIRNFRGFETLDINFEPNISNLTVFIGENGTGKTTVLEAIAKSLEIFTYRATHPTDISTDELKAIFQPSDIKNGKNSFSNHIFLNLEFEKITFENKAVIEYAENQGISFEEASIQLGNIEETEVSAVDIKDTRAELSWKVGLGKKGYQIQEFSQREQLVQFVDTINYRLQNDYPVNLPVLAYFPVKATPSDWSFLNNQQTHFDFDIFETYNDALNGRAFDFKMFFEWFKWQENLEKQFGINDKLDNVRNAIYIILNDSHEKDSVFDRLHIDWRTSTGEMVIYKNGLRMLVNQFSSGEKAVVSMVAAISLRLILANPDFPTPLHGNGIVLIDEIDLHLHPSWERSIINKLLEIFPNVQFIVTTHSPFVLQNVPSESIIVLKEGKISDKKHYALGRDISAVSFEIFGQGEFSTESQKGQELLRMAADCFDLIEDEQFEEAELIYKNLQKYWPHLDTRMVEIRAALNLSQPHV
jgi:predicted ATP-binding protein involved in virulence